MSVALQTDMAQERDNKYDPSNPCTSPPQIWEKRSLPHWFHAKMSFTDLSWAENRLTIWLRGDACIQWGTGIDSNHVCQMCLIMCTNAGYNLIRNEGNFIR